MSHSLNVQPSAKRDIAEAAAYYTRHGEGEAFIAGLDKVFLQIRRS